MTDGLEKTSVFSKVLCSSEGQNALMDQRSGTAPQHRFALGRWRRSRDCHHLSGSLRRNSVQKHQTREGITSVDVAC